MITLFLVPKFKIFYYRTRLFNVKVLVINQVTSWLLLIKAWKLLLKWSLFIQMNCLNLIHGSHHSTDILGRLRRDLEFCRFFTYGFYIVKGSIRHYTKSEYPFCTCRWLCGMMEELPQHCNYLSLGAARIREIRSIITKLSVLELWNLLLLKWLSPFTSLSFW